MNGTANGQYNINGNGQYGMNGQYGADGDRNGQQW